MDWPVPGTAPRASEALVGGCYVPLSLSGLEHGPVTGTAPPGDLAAKPHECTWPTGPWVTTRNDCRGRHHPFASHGSRTVECGVVGQVYGSDSAATHRTVLEVHRTPRPVVPVAQWPHPAAAAARPHPLCFSFRGKLPRRLAMTSSLPLSSRTGPRSSGPIVDRALRVAAETIIGFDDAVEARPGGGHAVAEHESDRGR